MALWTDLTPEQQDIVATYSRETRGVASDHQKVINKMANLSSQWNANVGAIVATLDAGEAIPDNNGLDGSETFTANDLTLLTSYYQNHNENHANVAATTPAGEGYEWSGYSTQRNKAAGPTNMV